ncbi:MAG: hypothetical protein QXQ81_05295 [Candidatus Thorarchaeota archaeon]
MMARSKSMVMALTDIKIALGTRFVRWSLYGMGSMGVVLVTLFSLLPVLIPASGVTPEVPHILGFMASTMLSLMAAVPASLIAASALVGEKESRTLEPLLATPLTDREILWGKVLGALIPSYGILFGGAFVSVAVSRTVAMISGSSMVTFPTLADTVMILGVGPILCLCVVSVMILVSGRSRRMYEAYQSGSVVILLLIPALFIPSLLVEQTGSLDRLAELLLMTSLFTLLLVVLAAVLTWSLALARFNRDRMVSRV